MSSQFVLDSLRIKKASLNGLANWTLTNAISASYKDFWYPCLYMKKTKLKFTRNVRGKILDRIAVLDDGAGYTGLEIFFQDGTAVFFDLIPRVTLKPEFIDYRPENVLMRRLGPDVTVPSGRPLYRKTRLETNVAT